MVPTSIHIKSCLVRELGEERGGLGLIVELLGPQGWGRRDETAGRRQMHSASSSGSLQEVVEKKGCQVRVILSLQNRFYFHWQGDRWSDRRRNRQSYTETLRDAELGPSVSIG